MLGRETLAAKDYFRDLCYLFPTLSLMGAVPDLGTAIPHAHAALRPPQGRLTRLRVRLPTPQIPETGRSVAASGTVRASAPSLAGTMAGPGRMMGILDDVLTIGDYPGKPLSPPFPPFSLVRDVRAPSHPACASGALARPIARVSVACRPAAGASCTGPRLTDSAHARGPDTTSRPSRLPLRVPPDPSDPRDRPPCGRLWDGSCVCPFPRRYLGRVIMHGGHIVRRADRRGAPR